MRTTVFGATCVLTLVACGEGLPLVERIANTRPLAVRVEVQDAAMRGDQAARTEALPLETVTIEPLFVDPAGLLDAATIAAEIEPVWLSCDLQPTQGLFGCISEAVPVSAEDIVDCPPPLLEAPDLEGFEAPPSPCWLRPADPAKPELTVGISPTYLLGGDIEVTMVGHRPGASSTPACLDALLSAGDPDADCLYVTQRVAVGPDAALLELAEEFGIPPSSLPPGPDEVPDADRHPRLQEVRVAVFESAADDAAMTGVFTPTPGEILEIAWGSRLEVEAEASPDDLQTYLVPGDAGDYTPRTEFYEGSWFVTWGELLSPSSDDPLSQNTWTLVAGTQDETDLPEGEVATLVYVLRDDRQGVTWSHFAVRVTGEPEE
jgi:hypothetical protein